MEYGNMMDAAAGRDDAELAGGLMYGDTGQSGDDVIGVEPVHDAPPAVETPSEDGLPETKVERTGSWSKEIGTSSTEETGTSEQTTRMRFTGQDEWDRAGEAVEAQKAKVAELEQRLRLPDVNALADGKFRERVSALERTGALPPEGPERERMFRRLHRRVAREAEREYEEAKDIRNKWLNPDYEEEKKYRRKQNILSIISALGDLGAMGGRAVTAANSGVILPFESLSSGRAKDRKQSDKERQALKAGLEQLAQARLAEEQAKLTDLEKAQLDILKNPNLYERVVSGSTSKNTDTGTSKKGSKGATGRTYGGETGGSADPWKNARKNGNAVDIGLSLKEDGSTKGIRTMSLAFATNLYQNVYNKIVDLEKKHGVELTSSGGSDYEAPKLKDILSAVKGEDAEANARRGDILRTNLAISMRMLNDNLYRDDLSEAQKDRIRDVIAQYDRDADNYSRMSMDGYDPYRSGDSGLGTREAGDSDKDMDW